jgi:phosphonate transport system substrate-binding protein
LVHKNSGIERLEQLQAKHIMIAQRISILFQMSEQQLKEEGLHDGKNITILETRTHNNAMWAPLRGEADAAVTGNRLFDKLPHEHKNQLRVIAETPVAPGLMLMAHPRVPAEQVTRVQEAVLSFGDSPKGMQYFTHTGSRGFALISNSVMLALDPYIDIVRPDD